jgi:general secretion pathway protein L
MLEAGMLETGGAGPTRGIKLAHEAGGTGGRQRVSTSFMAAACCLLLVLVLATPFLRQALILVELRGRLAEMAPRIAQVQALRARIAGAGAGGDAVAAETRRLGDALKALAALTDILPDDSYLTEFTMRERKMTVSGLGASAPKLISLLSADPRIRNPAFTAPVTRSETNHLDVFAIRAELAP